MPTIRLTVPLPLPAWLCRGLWRLKHAVRGKRRTGPDLSGDREVEFSFIAGHLPDGPGRAFDFGCGSTSLSLMAAERGFDVVAFDREPQTFPWRHPRIIFRHGDLLHTDFPDAQLDLIINCSAVEHVGLTGRYGVTNGDSDGDLHAMARLRAMLRPTGIMLLTIPCGRDAVFSPLHRVYGRERLPRLLEGFGAEEEAYWIKDSENCWVQCGKETALDFHPTADLTHPVLCSCALGCFVLRRE